MLGIGAAKRLALEHLAGGKALAHDQTPSISTRVSEVMQCVLWCAQSKVKPKEQTVEMLVDQYL